MMKRLILTVAAILTLGSFASAAEWLTNYAQALSQAKAQNKMVLMDFTGSDWCSWCIRLDREVFSLRDFKNYAAEKLILLKIDFPQGKALPAAEAAQNEKLRDHFRVEGFPTVIVLKPNGTKVGELNYVEGGPKAFISAVEKITMKN